MKILLIVLIMLSINVVQAQENRWVPITIQEPSIDSDGLLVSIDSSTAKQGLYPEVWTELMESKCSNDGNCWIEKRALSKALYDCGSRKFARLRTILYDKSNNVLADQDYSRDKVLFEETIPATAGEAQLNYICKNYYKPSKKK